MKELEKKNIIVNMFDIKKMRRLCNKPNCKKKPRKEVTLFERSIKSIKPIVKLYLCEEHANMGKELKVALSKLCSDTFIEMDIKNLKNEGR